MVVPYRFRGKNEKIFIFEILVLNGGNIIKEHPHKVSSQKIKLSRSYAQFNNTCYHFSP